jgi:DNA polymerase-3 subunit beta
LIGAINRTKFACDTDSTRYQLGGVLIETGEQLTLVATDGRRLSKICIDATNGKAGSTAIVPHKGLAAIVKAISGAADVNVHISNSSICVATEAAYVESRIIEGRFPAYDKCIPAMESMKLIPIEAGPFVSAMRQALVVANAEHRAVTLAFTPGELAISAKASDVGVVDTSMPVDTSETITTIIDGRFVADFAERCGSDEVFELRLKSESERAVFIAGEWTYVVMPMARS